MKSLRILAVVALVMLAVQGFAESDAQKAFEKLKILGGTWTGVFEGKPIQVTIRVTSSGNLILHEATQSDDPYDPITTIYLDGDRLLMTHYCDAGNRPRFQGRLSTDGKEVVFDLVDMANFDSHQHGHMQHVVFHFSDNNHHSEDWTFAANGEQTPETGHLELQRAQ